MAITMQGSWTVRVSSVSAAFAQRLVITGAATGNGTYTGTTGTAVFVTGSQWSINVQSSSDGSTWRDSAHRITFPSVSAGLLSFRINTDDSGNDKDFNDLVLTCSLPVASSEYVVYGTAKTYEGFCLFNPCRRDFGVIEPAFPILDICRRFPEICEPLRKLYPERFPGRIPLPDPPPDLRPILLPNLTPAPVSGQVFQSRRIDFKPPADNKPGTLDAAEKSAVERLQARVRAVSLNSPRIKAGADRLTPADHLQIAKITDAIALRCSVENAPGLLLRFQEYDRTALERAGDPYSGLGARQDLGLAVTDEQGNYIFRFSRTDVDVAEETTDVATGEVLADALRPDLIPQVLGTGMTATWETAPHFNVFNLQRIDLCIPRDRAHPTRACSGDRVIQRIGDIIVLNSALGGSPNTLDAQGRITCRNANAPQVDCAGWRGALRVYCCFGNPAAVRYAIYTKRPAQAVWKPVEEPHKLNYIPAFAPGYDGTTVGPFPAVVTPGVPTTIAAGQPVPTYLNREGDLNWIENDLKIILHTLVYRALEEPGPVQFRIEAYNAAGAVIAGITDQITLYLHDRTIITGRPQNSKGDIGSITMGGTSLGDCGLFTLTSPNAPLTVRHRAVDPEGFLHSWSLSVLRGNNIGVPVNVVGGVTPAAYNSSGIDCNFTGTREFGSADDYVDTTLQPSGGANWLPPGVQFCAFAFQLRATDRVTDGRTAHPLVVAWDDLIGLQV